MGKWYETEMSGQIGCATIIFASCLGLATLRKGCASTPDESEKIEIERIKASATYQLREGDLNDNGKPEKFYLIDKQVAPVEVDGEPILKFIRNKTPAEKGEVND